MICKENYSCLIEPNLSWFDEQQDLNFASGMSGNGMEDSAIPTESSTVPFNCFTMTYHCVMPGTTSVVNIQFDH